MAKFPGNTIQLSDTIDQYARRVHINVRNEKVTLVYRWKDRMSSKAHTQRMTLGDDQAARLLASVAVAAVVAVGEDKAREVIFKGKAESEIMRLGTAADAS
ncbi:MAG: hypothetical protein [Bacteriophage sp.]|nr:MAG: hypothetical protein [Bacteriophage sp.]